MGGWILSFFMGHFVNLIPPARPVLLFLDEHSSHINLVNTAKFARANAWRLLYCLRNVGVFGPLKRKTVYLVNKGQTLDFC